MSLLEQVKNSMHISNSKSDGDIRGEIAAAKQLLRVSGVELADENDELIVSAIKAYVKGVYNYQGEGERWLRRFDELRDLLPLAAEYRSGGGQDGAED